MPAAVFLVPFFPFCLLEGTVCELHNMVQLCLWLVQGWHSPRKPIVFFTAVKVQAFTAARSHSDPFTEQNVKDLNESARNLMHNCLQIALQPTEWSLPRLPPRHLTLPCWITGMVSGIFDSHIQPQGRL